MANIEYKNSLELAVKVIYGEVFGLPTMLYNAKTDWTEDVLTLANAIELIKESYSFKGKKVADALRLIHEKGLVSSVNFGREGGMTVLYIAIPFWECQATNFSRNAKESEKIPEKKRKEMAKEVMKILEDLANAWKTEYGYYEIKAIWL